MPRCVRGALQVAQLSSISQHVPVLLWVCESTFYVSQVTGIGSQSNTAQQHFSSSTLHQHLSAAMAIRALPLVLLSAIFLAGLSGSFAQTTPAPKPVGALDNTTSGYNDTAYL